VCVCVCGRTSGSGLVWWEGNPSLVIDDPSVYALLVCSFTLISSLFSFNYHTILRVSETIAPDNRGGTHK